MQKNIAWFTFVIVAVLAANLFRKTGFDQNARNIAAQDEVKIRVIEGATSAMDKEELRDIADLAQRIRRQQEAPIGAGRF